MLDKSTWVAIIFSLLLVIVVVGSALAVDVAVCNAKTANIGFPHTWGPLAGCLIEVTPGQWIPLDNYYFKQE